MPDPLRLALGTLTALPVPAPRRVDRRTARAAMLLAPLAVAPLALLVTAVGVGGPAAGLPTVATGLLAVAALALGTRALHWDGLSDTADGLAASYDRARSLRVMRTGTSGPAGTLATVLVAGLQAVGLGALMDDAEGAVLAGLLVLCSRVALATACASTVPSARAQGLGATVAGTVPVAAAAASWVVAAALAVGAALALGLDAVRAGVAVALAAVVVVALVARCVARLGGVTGDVLGAGVETAFAVLVVVAA